MCACVWCDEKCGLYGRIFSSFTLTQCYWTHISFIFNIASEGKVKEKPVKEHIKRESCLLP